MFCMRLISNARECIAPPPERIVYCYSVYQPIFDQFPNVEFVEGLPDLNMFDGVKRTLLIIDDLMHETNDTVAKLLIIIIIIIIWFGDTVTVSHSTKCDTNSKVRALS